MLGTLLVVQCCHVSKTFTKQNLRAYFNDETNLSTATILSYAFISNKM